MAAGQKGRAPGPKLAPLWERLQGQIDWYDRKAKINQLAYKISKISIIALAVLIPVFAEYGHIPGFEASPAFLVGAASGAIVLIEGLQVINKWQENWILYRATCEGLRNEQHLSQQWGAASGVSFRQGQDSAAAQTAARDCADLSMQHNCCIDWA